MKSLKVKVILVITACIMIVIMGMFFVSQKKATIPTQYLIEKNVNLKSNPIGIESNPEFSWQLISDKENQLQKAYRIVVAKSSNELAKKKYCWDSGKVESDFSVGISYDGPELEAKTRYYWNVTIWNQDDEEITSLKEDISYFEMGITDNNWKDAKWIAAPANDSSDNLVNTATRFSISYNFEGKNTYSGLIFGADKSAYGKEYFCGFDTRESEVVLVTARIEKEIFYEENKVSLSEFGFNKEEFEEKQHSVDIEVIDTKVRIFVDSQKISEYEITDKCSSGLIGIYTTRGAYTAFYDNILVKDSDGNILIDEKFEGTDNIFSPYYIKKDAGRLKATSGFLIMPGVDEPAPIFEKSFDIKKANDILEARLYCSALGIYDIKINSLNITDEYFAPGVSRYDERIYYRTYDVTEFIKENNNLQITLGHGRYDRLKNNWGDKIAFKCELDIKYKDGLEETIVSDESWKVYLDGPVKRDDYYWGEFYDNSCIPGKIEDVTVVEVDNEVKLTAFESDSVKEIQVLTPVSYTLIDDNTVLYDFGQNFSGFCRIALKGKQGQVITIRYGEETNKEGLSNKDDEPGTLWTENLYMAQNTDYFVLSGSGDLEIFDPKFVYRGFRYVQISGVDSNNQLDLVEGVVLSTDLEETGSFTCSNELMNSIYNSIRWTQLSNFSDIATDCPQRDERFGWTGDFNVYASTATYNSQTYNYFMNFLEAMYDCQEENGALPDMAYKDDTASGNSGWGDAGITVPWLLYHQYGIITPLEKYFDGMCKYVDYLVEDSQDYITVRNGYGDHNSVSSAENAYSNTAQSAYAAYIVYQSADILGKEEAKNKYQKEYESFVSAWRNKYLNEDGSIGSWTESEYITALGFGLYPEELKATGVEKLEISINAGGTNPTTGYITTQFLLPVLSENNLNELAYQMIQSTTFPSWGYMLGCGATTITEGWNTYKIVNENEYIINGSLNHYGLASVGKWYYENVLGIQKDDNKPGFKHFYIKPQPGGGLSFASGEYQSIYGAIKSSWEYTSEGIVYRFTIPANTTATVTLPDSEYINAEYGSGTYEILVRSN